MMTRVQQRGVMARQSCTVSRVGIHTHYARSVIGVRKRPHARDFVMHTADVRCKAGEGLPPELKQSIDDFVQENTVVVFMKGTKDMPMCGFSNTVVQILNQLNVPYVTVNVLDNDVLRNGMKEYSMWPTFPQVYVSGEFYGGCDIMIESYTSGELQETLEIALLS